MKHTNTGTLFQQEVQDISAVLELINYRPGTIDNYVRAILTCCAWLMGACGISIGEADIHQLRLFLLYLKRPAPDGLGYAPRTVNIYNCAIKKYFRFVLRKPLTNDDLPLCKVDSPLPRVFSKKEIRQLVFGTRNLKHRAELAVAYGAALRIGEVAALRFRDISFSENTVTVTAPGSKNRHEGKVELPLRLRKILLAYYRECFPGASPDDWLFPGQNGKDHISSTSLRNVFKKRLEELGWERRGYTFHSLRHAHALHYYQSGADLFQVMQRLRHRSVSSTLVYVRLDAKLRERKNVGNPFDDPSFPDC